MSEKVTKYCVQPLPDHSFTEYKNYEEDMDGISFLETETRQGTKRNILIY